MRVKLDFNAHDEVGRLIGLTEELPGAVSLGEMLWGEDEDGNGEVVRLVAVGPKLTYLERPTVVRLPVGCISSTASNGSVLYITDPPPDV